MLLNQNKRISHRWSWDVSTIFAKWGPTIWEQLMTTSLTLRAEPAEFREIPSKSYRSVDELRGEEVCPSRWMKIIKEEVIIRVGVRISS